MAQTSAVLVATDITLLFHVCPCRLGFTYHHFSIVKTVQTRQPCDPCNVTAALGGATFDLSVLSIFTLSYTSAVSLLSRELSGASILISLLPQCFQKVITNRRKVKQGVSLKEQLIEK